MAGRIGVFVCGGRGARECSWRTWYDEGEGTVATRTWCLRMRSEDWRLLCCRWMVAWDGKEEGGKEIGNEGGGREEGREGGKGGREGGKAGRKGILSALPAREGSQAIDDRTEKAELHVLPPRSGRGRPAAPREEDCYQEGKNKC